MSVCNKQTGKPETLLTAEGPGQPYVQSSVPFGHQTLAQWGGNSRGGEESVWETSLYLSIVIFISIILTRLRYLLLSLTSFFFAFRSYHIVSHLFWTPDSAVYPAHFVVVATASPPHFCSLPLLLLHILLFFRTVSPCHFLFPVRQLPFFLFLCYQIGWDPRSPVCHLAELHLPVDFPFHLKSDCEMFALQSQKLDIESCVQKGFCFIYQFLKLIVNNCSHIFLNFKDALWSFIVNIFAFPTKNTSKKSM